MSRLAGWARGLVRFVVEFFVGDTPELFVVVVLLLGVLGLVSRGAGAHTLAAVCLPLGVLSALSLSLARAVRRTR